MRRIASSTSGRLDRTPTWYSPICNVLDAAQPRRSMPPAQELGGSATNRGSGTSLIVTAHPFQQPLGAQLADEFVHILGDLRLVGLIRLGQLGDDLVDRHDAIA